MSNNNKRILPKRFGIGGVAKAVSKAVDVTTHALPTFLRSVAEAKAAKNLWNDILIGDIGLTRLSIDEYPILGRLIKRPLLIVDRTHSMDSDLFMHLAKIIELAVPEIHSYFNSPARMHTDKRNMDIAKLLSKDNLLPKYNIFEYNSGDQLLYPIRVEFVNDMDSDVAGQKNAVDNLGDVNIIRLVPDLTDDTLKKIIRHELLHAGSLGEAEPDKESLIDNGLNNIGDMFRRVGTNMFYKYIIDNYLFIPRSEALASGMPHLAMKSPEEFADYVYSPSEAATYLFDIGYSNGFKLGLPYEGDEMARNLLELLKYRYDKDSARGTIVRLILNNPRARKLFWEMLGGVGLSTVPIVGMFSNTQNA